MTLEARHAILDALLASLDEEHAIAVMDHRKTKKCALTVFAAKLLAKQFALCPDPNAAAEEMILRGWQGFKAEWLAMPTNQRTGRRNYVDVARDRMNGNGPEGIFGSRIDVERLSDGSRQPGSDDGNLRGSVGGHGFPSRH